MSEPDDRALQEAATRLYNRLHDVHSGDLGDRRGISEPSFEADGSVHFLLDGKAYWEDGPGGWPIFERSNDVGRDEQGRPLHRLTAYHQDRSHKSWEDVDPEFRPSS